jgi:hypothetical protein
MSVLKLRRDMVVVEDAPATDPVVENDRPFPLRTRESVDSDIIEADVVDADEDHDDHDEALQTHKTFGQHVRFWFNTIAIVGLLGAYPTMVVASSDVGDRNLDALVNRADWTAPWVGGVATLMEQHFNDLGWASDSEAWEPMARLTAKPAYQSAMAASLGDVVRLANAQAVASGQPDVDLEAAARLVKEDSTGVQLRAARDALLNHDRRLRRRDASTDLSARQVTEELALLTAWAAVSQERIIASASTIGGSPMDEEATRAVYAAKGRATVAFLLLDAMKWQEPADVANARNAALSAWKQVAEFHPLVVLNGDPDGSLWGNHPAAMSYLIGRAEEATQAYAGQVKAIAPPVAPSGVASAPGVSGSVAAVPGASR